MADKEFPSIPIKQFRGQLILPVKTDVPPEFASSCQNVAYLPGAVLSRPGTTSRIALGGGTDVFHMEILLWSSGRYHLLLMNGPELFYSFDYGARTSLKSGLPANTTVFRQHAYGTRVFFTFADKDTGLIAPFVWDPATDDFDSATEAAPTVGSFAAADGSASSGDGCDAGVHKLIVIYETRSGFQTSPTPASTATQVEVTSAGGNDIDLTNIPTGGSTVTKRHIGLTAAGLGTFYLAATINNNVDTTLSLDIADAQLIQQTELSNWFQFKHPLPNMRGVIQYHDRMVYWGDSSDKSLLWISEKGLPATVRADFGFLNINKEDGDGISNCFVLGDVLYITKSRSIYSIVDNGDDPFNWGNPRLVCSWAGTLSVSGVALTNDKHEAFILDVKGIYRFRGGDPQSLSDAIQPYFDEESTIVTPINHAFLARAEIHYDPQKRRIMAWVPTGSSEVPDTLLVCDVREGFDRRKWAPWVTAGTAWRSFAVDSIEINIAEAGPVVVKLDDEVISDRTTAIDWHYQPGSLAKSDDGMNLFHGLGMRVTGAGNLNITVYDQDEALLLTPAVFTLISSPGKDFFRRLNLRKERFFARVGQNNASASAKISQMTAYMKEDGVRSY